jgi:DNA replicative helicase MCM subunit Mcm2 (Cdc46/Mcm family)
MVRLELQPLLTPPAEALLSTYYQQQRQAVDRSAARTTIRMLESAIRLSQSHARLCFRSSVVVLDACVAISLLEGTRLSLAFVCDRSSFSRLQLPQRSRHKWLAGVTQCMVM